MQQTLLATPSPLTVTRSGEALHRSPPDALHCSPLDALHRAHGARMVAFAGWSMPLQYPSGTIAEHLHCRAAAALFDVSHMGQIALDGTNADRALEALVPADLAGLPSGRQRYTQLLNAQGGIIDDLMVSRLGDRLLLVLNAANAAADIAHLASHLPAAVSLTPHPEPALLALQGPRAAEVLARLVPAIAATRFLEVIEAAWRGHPMVISRSGYTGEDGFEIALRAEAAEPLARALLACPEVALAGLGARDTLRLEAGLCLHGNDISIGTNPVEAGLGWSIPRRRRAEGGFLGAAAVRAAFANPTGRRRVGIALTGPAPARRHTPITSPGGEALGEVCSGLYAPTLQQPIAMGYVPAAHAARGTQIVLDIRGRPVAARIVALPFVPHRYRIGEP